MLVTPTSAAGTGANSTPAAAAHSSTVDYNSFLQLLVTQLKNQDPTAPTDSTAFMSQLASFSNVEQSVQMNSKFDSLLQISQLSQADGMIGRTASSTDGVTSGIVKSVRIDSNGVVATLDNGATLNVGSGIVLS
ncbi:MAG: flagellar hook capping - N-terminal region family protein [Hyphomicrobiales bacterium]|nr:flagellar hook capping - N-terminal region family protein [Hyphomicrobiales bacterium]